MWLVAGAWADAWRIPDSAPLIRVMAITLFLSAATTVPLALLRRRLRFRAAASAEVGTQVVGVTAGVLLAVQMHSAMALVIGQAIAAGALLLPALILTRRELRWHFSLSETRYLASFASQVAAQNIGFFTLYTAPGWVIARLFGARDLGVYSRANVIVGLPLNYLTTGLIKVMYPFYGLVGEQVARVRALLSETITIATGFAWIFFGLVAGASPIIVDVLLGRRWHDSADLIPLCVLIACANLPWVLLANAAEAFRWMRLVWSVQGAFALVLGGGFVLVWLASLEPRDVLIAAAAAQWAAYLLLLVAFARRGVLATRMVMNGHLIHGAIALAAYGAAAACTHLLRGESLPIQVIGQLAVAAAVGGALVVARFRVPCSRVLGARVALAATSEQSQRLGRLSPS